jgi:hypothetical protein
MESRSQRMTAAAARCAGSLPPAGWPHKRPQPFSSVRVPFHVGVSHGIW